MPPLSEKAKGKQRAVDISLEPVLSTLPELPAHRDVLIRFSEGAHDLLIPVTHDNTIKDIKAQIREQRPMLERRRLKIIHSGRLLVDATHLLEYIQTLESRAHARDSYNDSGALSRADTNGKGKARTEPQRPIWLHCSVGTRLEPHEEDDGTIPQPSTEVNNLRGFDRLVGAGLTEAEIAMLRTQFHSTPQGLDDLVYGGGTVLNDEELEDQARTLEERWIDSLDMGRDATALAPSSSPVATLVQGLLVGFFFPIIPFFFMYEQRQAAFWSNGRSAERPGSVVFSRRMQIAIVMGFVMNISFGIWRYLSS